MVPFQTDKPIDPGSNYISVMTAMLRVIKLSTNDYVCANRAVAPFAVKQTRWISSTPAQRDNLGKAAAAFVLVYEKDISLNRRTLDLLRSKLPYDPIEYIDRISTLQVEREENFHQLPNLVTLTLLSLIDLRPTDVKGNFIQPTSTEKGHTTRITLTKQQKQEMLDFIATSFPNLSNGTPKDKLTMTESMAGVYLVLLDGHFCLDE